MASYGLPHLQPLLPVLSRSVSVNRSVLCPLVRREVKCTEEHVGFVNPDKSRHASAAADAIYARSSMGGVHLTLGECPRSVPPAHGPST